MSPPRNSFPVEPFERFMLAGDSRDYPMSFVFSFELAGRLDTSRLKLAVERCVKRHPLMFSTIDSKRKNWCFRPELASSVFVADDMNSSSLRTFDLSTEIGLRIIVADKDASSSEILFVFPPCLRRRARCTSIYSRRRRGLQYSANYAGPKGTVAGSQSSDRVSAEVP